jgi:N-acyl-L-homoserine lactone synthetase
MLGALTLVTVSPVSMERLLRLNGFHAKRAGVPMMSCGMPITALKINCAMMTLE